MSLMHVSLEELWNNYAIEEDVQCRKLKLEIFLSRANEEDFRPFILFARRRVVAHLIQELKADIGLFCGPDLAPEDLEQLTRLVDCISE